MRNNKIKANLFFFAFLALFTGCVSSGEYENLKKQKQDQSERLNSEIELLRNELSRLKSDIQAKNDEIEDVKFNIPKLLAEGKELERLKDFRKAKAKYDILILKHPETVEASKAKLWLVPLKEEIQWQDVKDATTEFEVNKYLFVYPNGKYSSEANRKINEIKRLNREKAFEEAKRLNTSSSWKRFLENYPDYHNRDIIESKIIDLEVGEILSDRSTGSLPAFQKSYYGSSNSYFSNITITNDTRRELVVRYSGPSTKKISIRPGGTSSVRLVSGSYRVAASAEGLHYGGTIELTGDYTSTYYISTSRY